MLTSQEKKEYLQQYKTLDNYINRNLEELESWKSLATKVTPTYSKTPKGSNHFDKIQTAIENIINLEHELNRSIDDFVASRMEIEKAINSVEDKTLMLILQYRYIDALTFEKIADKMNYSYKQICRLHDKALNIFELS